MSDLRLLNTEDASTGVALVRARADELRGELADLMRILDTVAPRTEPVGRTIQSGGGEYVDIWGDGPTLRIHTMTHADGAVYIASPNWPGVEALPNWTALSTQDARAIAQSLLAAADAAEKGTTTRFVPGVERVTGKEPR